MGIHETWKGIWRKWKRLLRGKLGWKQIQIGLVVAGAFALLLREIKRRRALKRATAPARSSYVVVGGGTAGLALASRLSQDPSVTVVVLEAGGSIEERPWAVGVPLAATELQRTDVDWQYVTEPQAATLGRVHRWPRGKMVGGSSGINWMLYVRGCWADFTTLWEQQLGCVGWGWQDVFPYFVRSERRHNVEDVRSGYHGTEGPLDVTDAPGHPLARHFVDACEQVGLRRLQDYNGASQLGAGLAQLMIDPNGERCDSARSFLQLAAHRPNLTVVSHTHASRLLFADTGLKTVGVEYIRPDGSTARIFCDREVILCAGAIGSAQLLLLSGIGPEEQLRAHRLPVRMALPGVGEHLQDHLMVPCFLEARGPVTMDESLVRTPWSIARYMLFRTGPLRSQGLEAVAFARSSQCALPMPVPDLQVHCVLGLPTERVYQNLNLQWKPGSLPRYGFILLPTLLHPRSCGHLRLRSANPLDHPLLDPHYLEHEDDVRVLVEGLRLAESIAQAKGLAPWHRGRVLDAELARLAPVDSDAYREAWVRKYAINVYHYAGTCAMGPKSNPRAVVDVDLRVHGVDGLRVADASIFPEIPSANTCAPTYMVAERAADLIASYWHSKLLAVNAFSPSKSNL